MAGLPDLKHPAGKFRDGRRLAQYRDGRELTVDIDVGQGPIAAFSQGGAEPSPPYTMPGKPSEPSPYGQPLVMPVSLRGTKRDFRSPRMPQGGREPHTGREPAARKVRRSQLPAESANGDENAPGPTGIAASAGPATVVIPQSTHNERTGGASLAPVARAGSGTMLGDNPTRTGSHSSSRDRESEGPTTGLERLAPMPVAPQGNGVAWSDIRTQRTNRASRPPRSSRAAFTEAAKLYQKPQPPG
jgi:hypothetical protein